MNTVSNEGRTKVLTMRRALWLLLLLLIAGGLYLGLGSKTAPLAPVSTVTIAVPIQISTTSTIVAAANGLFAKAGVEVISQPFELGKDALQSVIKGNADLALVADTPLMFALLKGEDISILAATSQGRRALAVVGRKDRGIQRLQDLKGKSVGVTSGTNLTYFLDAMLQTYGIPSETLRLVDLDTPGVVKALVAGDIDAATLYQPFLARVQEQMGDQVNVFYGDDVYSFRTFLVGKTSYIDSHPQEIRRILTALNAANQAIRADPVKARQTLAKAMQVDDGTLVHIFDTDTFTLSLDQAMLLSLDDQTRWAMKRGLVKAGPVPNFLKSIKLQHLEAVVPDAVTVVH
jgi:ABC-type nitrate/sulfonate/bicarbonate transport system substrate-binding protein